MFATKFKMQYHFIIMKLITIDIKSEQQTVKQAIAEFLVELDACRKGGYKVLKVIHGYGSHGVGGAIKREFLHECQNLKGRGKIEDYVCCDNWTERNITRKIAINYCPDLLADRELYLLNPGCSIVIVWCCTA